VLLGVDPADARRGALVDVAEQARAPDRLNTPLLQDLIGKTLSSRSTVSRIAQAWEYGPKYFTPFFLAPRPTMTRGNSSLRVTASQG
jgi:hypothetical protein